MELAFGKSITKEVAEKLGVLDAAEGFVRDAPDKPWQMLVPADVPVRLSGNGKDQQGNQGDQMGAERFIGKMLSGTGPGLLGGLGDALVDDDTPDSDKDGVTHAEAKPNNFDKGGKVQKTGVAVVHKGETVIPVKKSASLHRALSHLHKGGLHRALGVQEGQPIPQDKLAAAKNSDNPHIKHMANFASVLEGFHHKQ